MPPVSRGVTISRYFIALFRKVGLWHLPLAQSSVDTRSEPWGYVLTALYLLRLPTVCWRWRSVIDSLIEDCRARHAAAVNADSTPTSNIHLYLITRANPTMKRLRGPQQGRLDLDAVGECNLKTQSHLSCLV